MKTTTVIFFILITMLTPAQSKINVGLQELEVGKKISNIIFLDRNKKADGNKEYYLQQTDTSKIIAVEVVYDPKHNILYAETYTFNLKDLEPQVDLTANVINGMGSHGTAPYYTVVVNNKTGEYLKYFTYENVQEPQNPAPQENAGYAFTYNRKNDAEAMAQFLNAYFKIIKANEN